MYNTDMTGAMLSCSYLGIPLYTLVLIILTAYLIGSIPFGLILTKIFGYGDIRKIGSGNIGATNVLRTGNKSLAIATLILDALKGIAAILFYNLIRHSGTNLHYIDINGTWPLDVITFFRSSSYHEIMSFIGERPPTDSNSIICLNGENIVIMLTALFAILGHCFSIWLKFKGGKGVATALGLFLFIAPYAGITACLTWLVTALIARISSLSALLALAVVPLVIFILYGVSAGYISIIISALIFYRHKENIKRLINGTEPKIGQKKNDVPPQA